MILLLKHLGKLASGIAVAHAVGLHLVAIELVTAHVVDEKERQYLDVLLEELTLSFDVGANGFLYLDAAQQVFVHLADGFALR